MMRGKRRFKLSRYGSLKLRALATCAFLGHDMVHATTWRWREYGVNEKFFCRTCRMEMLIQFKPPAGYGVTHGTALSITCIHSEERDHNPTFGDV